MSYKKRVYDFIHFWQALDKVNHFPMHRRIELNLKQINSAVWFNLGNNDFKGCK